MVSDGFQWFLTLLHRVYMVFGGFDYYSGLLDTFHIDYSNFWWVSMVICILRPLSHGF